MSVRIEVADAEHLPLDDRSVDLVLGSPPYCDARTYGIGAQRDCLEWVDWMLRVTAEAQRVSRGPVVWVAAGVTRDRNYWPACEGLMWEWWKRGGDCQLYRPVYWHRVGIPGSGHDDWMRADVEYCMLFKRAGKLPWSDNTACGYKPKWAPGGEMSHRLSDGQRVNQWGPISGGTRCADGTMGPRGRPSHRVMKKVNRCQRNGDGTRAEDGDEVQEYDPPAIANPGNLLKANSGYGRMGHVSAHRNEAPYPVAVPSFFIKSLCPPGGTVCDPFGGSGTTAHAAMECGRNAIMFDIRESQVELMKRRLATVTPQLEGLA